jgi:hypothetical protein
LLTFNVKIENIMNNVIRHSLAAAVTVPVSLGVGFGTLIAGTVFTEGMLRQFSALHALSNSTVFLVGSNALIGGVLSGTMTAGASLTLPQKKRKCFIALGSAVPVVASVVAGIAYVALLRPMGIAGVLLQSGTSFLINVLGTAAIVTALWKERGYNPTSIGLGTLAGIVAFVATCIAIGTTGAGGGTVIVAGAIGAGMIGAGLLSGAIQAIDEFRRLPNGA